MCKIKNIINAPLAFMGGILGALGGSSNSSKLYRRIGFPLLITIIATSKLHSLWLFSTTIMVFCFFIGYGIPDNNTGDEGSCLGRFWFKICNGNNFFTNFFTRGSVGILISFSLISIPIIKHNWLIYFLCSSGIFISQALISWMGFGSISFKNKELCISDLINYSIITGLSITLVYA
jgi:hypothetical protein